MGVRHQGGATVIAASAATVGADLRTNELAMAMGSLTPSISESVMTECVTGVALPNIEKAM